MRIVLRDATGKETVTEYPYYNATNLIAAGILDYSVRNRVRTAILWPLLGYVR